MFKKKLPGPIAILMLVIIIAAIATWLLPAGQYETLSYKNGSFIINAPGKTTELSFSQNVLDSLHIKIRAEKFESGAIRKPVSIPGTYRRLPRNSQGIVDISQAPIKGLYDAVEIVFFVLFIGGFMNIFNATGALEKGLMVLSYKMKGKEKWLIIILTFLFSFGGSSYGMAEEALVFYPVITPLFLSAGYDLLVPVAVIMGGTQIGYLSSFSNPFSTIIASNAAGVNWTDGFTGRLIIFVLSTGLTILYILRYTKKVKRDPKTSIVYRTDGDVKPPYDAAIHDTGQHLKMDGKSKLLLLIFLGSFLIMIGGVVFLDWWLLEMTALFLVSSIVVALLIRMKEGEFIKKFIQGAESLLAVSFIVGVARGVTIVLNDGRVSDTILYYSASFVSHLSPVLFIIILLCVFLFFSLFISSSSGMAVVTMPILGSLAFAAGVPGREIVNAYLYGMGIMGFMAPTGMLLPSLALVNVSYKAWLKFIVPLMIMLFVLCVIFLIIGIKL